MRLRVLALCLSSLLSLVLLARAADAIAVVPALQNGWTTAPYGNSRPEAFRGLEVVYLKGAMASGSAHHAFTLPPTMRPFRRVYTHVDLCGAEPGRLVIEPTGDVSVYDVEGGLADASCFASLDGVKFRVGSFGSQSPTLLNGWMATTLLFETNGFEVAAVDGFAYLRGGLWGGTSADLFVLPPGLRPATDVYIRVDLCSGRKGRLYIRPSGEVAVQTFGPFSDAQCFVSLEGASFALSTAGFQGLGLLNGWTNAPFSTSDAAVSLDTEGLVRFKGAIAGGSDPLLFTLPPAMRPDAAVWIPIDLCGSSPGRLFVAPSGEVRVEFPPPVTFASAQCFTSLDGASFIPTKTGFQPVNALNGWASGLDGTQTSSYAVYDGIVHLKGALTGGSSAGLFIQPLTAKPDRNIQALVDSCGGATGRLSVPGGLQGVVAVLSPPSLADAQCFTSLEGVSYPLESTTTTPFPLLNGWVAFSGGNPPGGVIVDGLVHLKGEAALGSSPLVFTLPPAMRPSSNAYVPILLRDGAKGRLQIQPNGDVLVSALTAFADAQAYTSFEGVTFAPASNTAFKPLTPLNGWTPSIYTDPPAAAIVRDIVYLKGSISTSGPSQHPFTLSPILRPEGHAYVPIDLCNGNKGRLVVFSTGVVFVETQLGGDFSNAQCFTSLDGVSYAVPEPAFVPALIAGLALVGGFGAKKRAARAACRGTSSG